MSTPLQRCDEPSLDAPVQSEARLRAADAMRVSWERGVPPAWTTVGLRPIAGKILGADQFG